MFDKQDVIDVVECLGDNFFMSKFGKNYKIRLESVYLDTQEVERTDSKSDIAMKKRPSFPKFIMVYSELLFATSNFEKFNVKDKGGTAGNDATGAAVTVAQVGRDRQLALLPNAHVLEALFIKL